MKQKQKSEMEELGAPVEESKREKSNGTNGVRTRRGKGKKSRGLAHENKTRDKRAPRDRFSRTGRPVRRTCGFEPGGFGPPFGPAIGARWLAAAVLQLLSLLAHLACTAGAHAPRRGGSGREVRCSTAHALLPLLLLLQGAATTQWSDGVVVVAGAGRAHRGWTVHKEKKKSKKD